MKYQELISQMTLEEKCYLFSGKDFWQSRSIERLGIPNMTMADGPHGVRKQEGAGDQLGLNGSIPATCFPTAATMANSWDPKLGEEMGKCLGEEAACQDVKVLLGPGVNIKRSPLCGRNFEYFSEDPYLTGKMAAGYIRGIQSHGVSACPKHFAANSQELRRMASDSVVDERTLREIYLTAFEIAVKEADPHAIMTSYNRIKAVSGKRGQKFDIEAHHAMAMKASEQSIVLLKNEDKILPLKKGVKVALIGDFAEIPRYQGAGSSVVNPTKVDSTKDVISHFDLDCIGFAKGYNRVGPADALNCHGFQIARLWYMDICVVRQARLLY